MIDPRPIPILSGIAPLATQCDAWILDVWGVLHNGRLAFPAASEACRLFRQSGGVVGLLSNAPRPAASVAGHLDSLGVPRNAYDVIVTSGDLTRRMLADRPGRPLCHIGPARDAPIFEGLDVKLVDARHAELVVCSGLFDDDVETPDDYVGLLTELAARDVPMICGNPDIKVERGERLVYCAGALAVLYERLGGRVVYAGKPHLPAYELMLETIARVAGRPVPKDRTLAVGDGLRTDIEGAANAGLRSVFIASALHVAGPLDAAVLTALFAGQPWRPVAAMAALAW